MAKVVVRHIDEYMSALQSKELTGEANRHAWFYIDRLKYAESLPKGSGPHKGYQSFLQGVECPSRL